MNLHCIKLEARFFWHLHAPSNGGSNYIRLTPRHLKDFGGIGDRVVFGITSQTFTAVVLASKLSGEGSAFKYRDTK